MPGIFISYRRDDSAGHAGHLHDELTDHFGRDTVFMDIDAIEAGEDFVEAIEDAVGSCDVLLAVIGSRWLTSADADGTRRIDKPDDFVHLEIAAALERDIRVVPVLVQNATMPAASDLPESLAKLTRRNAIELSNARWEYDLGRLIAVLEKVIGGGRDRRATGVAGRGARFVRRPVVAVALGGVATAVALALGAAWYSGILSPSRLPPDAVSADCGRVSVMAPSAPTNAPANDALRSRVERAFDALPGSASAVFVNLTGPDRVERDAEVQVSAASTIKLPLAIEVLRQAQGGAPRPGDRHAVTQARVVGGTGILRQHVGESLTTLQLLQTTLVYSDNTGGNMLIGLVGSESINRTMQQLGFGSTQLRRRFMDLEAERSGLVNVSSARDAAEMLKRLYLGELPLDATMRAELLRMLRCRGQRTEPELDFMGRMLMPRPALARINGTLPRVRNDVALFERDGRAFVLGIFLRDQANEAAAEDAIARAAKEVIDAVAAAR